jgi:hypothetical protein
LGAAQVLAALTPVARPRTLPRMLRRAPGPFALSGALAGALLAQQPAPAERSPPAPAATAAPTPPWPIVPPTDEWYDAKRLDALVAALRPVAEKHSGLRFLADPVVRVADYPSWEKLVGEEMPNARDPSLAVAITFALYVPARGEVVVGPYLGHHLLVGQRDGWQREQKAARPLLVHELVHVLQQQHFQLPSRMQQSDDGTEKLVLRSMVEGFATWVEERAAAVDFAIDGYAERNAKMHRRNNRMPYLRGRDFFARLHERGGDQAVHEAMKADPLPLHEFVKIATAKPAVPAQQPAATRETPKGREPAK